MNDRRSHDLYFKRGESGHAGWCFTNVGIGFHEEGIQCLPGLETLTEFKCFRLKLLVGKFFIDGGKRQNFIGDFF